MTIIFPKTPHLYNSKRTDDDRVLSSLETSVILKKDIIVQEKLDGNCIGFSFDSNGNPLIQNRNYLIDPKTDVYFKKVDCWFDQNADQLFDLCGDRYVLFGEWLYWKHTVRYEILPSFFVAYDIYDLSNNCFLSCKRVDEKLKSTTLSYNKPIFSGNVHCLEDLVVFITKSQFGKEQMEGLYIRVDNSEKNTFRGKYVSEQFSQQINTHWRKSPFSKNQSLSLNEKNW